MHHQIVQKFNVIGIPVRTTNEGGQSGKDIRVLWEKFRSEGVAEKIPHKMDNTLYSVYTDYEGDYDKPYTTILGCKVENLEEVPEGMVGKVMARQSHNANRLFGNVYVCTLLNCHYYSNCPPQFVSLFHQKISTLALGKQKTHTCHLSAYNRVAPLRAALLFPAFPGGERAFQQCRHLQSAGQAGLPLVRH